MAQEERRRPRHPELRPHARVPRGRVLHAWPSSRRRVCAATSRRSPTTIQRRRGRARRAPSPPTIKELGGTPVKAPGVDFGDAFASQDSFLEDRPDVRGSRSGRLQRRRPDDQVEGRARCGRLDRPGRGAPRGRDPLAARRADRPERVRQGPRDARGPGRRQAFHQGLTALSVGRVASRSPGAAGGPAVFVPAQRYHSAPMSLHHHSEFPLDRIPAERRCSVSVCVPARNEAATIGPILDSLIELAAARAIDQVVVVDDSSDDTAEIARARGAEVHRQVDLRTEVGPRARQGRRHVAGAGGAPRRCGGLRGRRLPWLRRPFRARPCGATGLRLGGLVREGLLPAPVRLRSRRAPGRGWRARHRAHRPARCSQPSIPSWPRYVSRSRVRSPRGETCCRPCPSPPATGWTSGS